jgi:LPS export ABC transporter protein LptC
MKTATVYAMLALALSAAACARSQSQPAAPLPSQQPGQPVYHISAQGTKEHPVTISNIRHGEREYILEAANVVYATNLQQGTFHDTLLHFFRGAKPRLTVTAPVATVDENTHDVDLSGGVVARTAAGDTLTSDTMTYNEKTRLLTAVGHVVAIDPSGYRLTGTRAIADLDLEQIHLFGAGPSPTEARAR